MLTEVKEMSTGDRALRRAQPAMQPTLRTSALMLLQRVGWLKLLLLLLPSLVLITIYLIIPIIMLVVMSFYRINYQAYQAFFVVFISVALPAALVGLVWDHSLGLRPRLSA